MTVKSLNVNTSQKVNILNCVTGMSNQKQFYGQPMQQGYAQSQSKFCGLNPQPRQGNQSQAANPNGSRYPSLPVGYYSQSWGTSPYQQQITGRAVHSGPRMYFVFNPSNFTDTYNPWTASMWLQNYNIPAYQKPQMPPVAQAQTSNVVQKPQSQQQQVLQQVQQQVQQQIPTSTATIQHQTAVNNNQTNSQTITQGSRVKSEIFQFDSVKQFQELRHHATIESALDQLNRLGTDLSKVNPSTFKPDSTSCFILCNTYTTPKYQLGVGPLNDAITVAANHKYMGYQIYFLHNPHHTIFMSFLRVFLEKVDKYLTIFYTGHGAQVKDVSGDEDDGYDEVMVFDSGIVVDDELAKYIKDYSEGEAHTILLTDCCHSGTIWDIPESLWKARKFPANIMSISAAQDNQTAKQTDIGEINQGIFTFNFWTLLRNQPSICIEEVQETLNPEFKRFNQQLVMYPTRKDMLKKPIFPLMAKGH